MINYRTLLTATESLSEVVILKVHRTCMKSAIINMVTVTSTTFDIVKANNRLNGRCNNSTVR